MQKLSFKLEVFEGPLDLLLHLILKHKLNIYDIEISKLLDQYLEYIDKYRQADMELAGEFLDMAARLIYIKTVSLLPKPNDAEKEKQTLQGELIEYSIAKQLSVKLSEKFVGMQLFVREPLKIKYLKRYNIHHDKSELVKAYNFFDRKSREEKAKLSAENKVKNVVSEKPVSVLSKVMYLMRTLYTKKVVIYDDLYRDLKGKSAKIAMFLAVLELTRKGRVLISEDNTKIYLNDRREEDLIEQ